MDITILYQMNFCLIHSLNWQDERTKYTYTLSLSLSCKNGMFDFFFFPKQKHLHFFVSNRTFAVFFHPDRMQSVNGFYFSVQIISAFSWYLFSTSVWYPHKCCRLYNIITYHLSETRKSHKKYLNVKQKIPHTHTHKILEDFLWTHFSGKHCLCS